MVKPPSRWLSLVSGRSALCGALDFRHVAYGSREMLLSLTHTALKQERSRNSPERQMDARSAL
eukprot:1555042-Prymnesium_polylepis.1